MGDRRTSQEFCWQEDVLEVSKVRLMSVKRHFLERFSVGIFS